MKGMHRSKSAKRKYVRTPRTTRLRFKKKKVHVPTCAQCGAQLHGVSRNRKGESTDKASSRPTRSHGGYLCHACLRKQLVESVRS